MAFWPRSLLSLFSNDLAIDLGTANTIVFARELSGMIEGFRYTGPAGAGFFSEVSKLVAQVQQGEIDEGLLRAVNQVGGILFHYPATEVERLVRAIANADEPADGIAALFGRRPD